MTNLVSYSPKVIHHLTRCQICSKKNKKVKPITLIAQHINSTLKQSNDIKTVTVIMAEQQGKVRVALPEPVLLASWVKLCAVLQHHQQKTDQ